MDSLPPIRNPSIKSFQQYDTTSPSPSRTLSSRQNNTDYENDFFPSNLSPNLTLDALLATDVIPVEKRHRRSFIQNSIQSASSSEKAWGFKAASASKEIRERHEELSGWPWEGFVLDRPKGEGEAGAVGISAAKVQEYGIRLEKIKEDIGTLEVEELKSYVRSNHPEPATGASAPAVEHGRLDDFAAVVTATIIQVLPTLSRLTSLLDNWSTRLLILRQVPAFLRDLESSQQSMLSATMAIEKPTTSTAKRRTDFSRKAFLDIKDVLQDQISHLGRKLDVMLDLLEGSRDCLPDKWIDSMDVLENQYGVWVVEAEELVLNNELNRFTNQHVLADTVSIDSQFDRNNTNTGSQSPIDSVAIQNEAQVTNLLKSAELNASVFDRDADRLMKRSHVIMKSAHRPAPLILDASSSHTGSTAPSEGSFSQSGSAISDYFSNKSSPEIRSAFVAEFHGSPIKVTTPTWMRHESMNPKGPSSQRSSVQTHHSAASLINGSFGAKGRDAHHKSPEPPHADRLEPSFIKGHSRARSASVQSFEVVPKSDIRKILVRRSGSYSHVIAPSKPGPPVAVDTQDSTPSPSEGPNENIKERSGTDSNTTEDFTAQNFLDGTASPGSPATEKASPKSRNKFERMLNLGAGFSPVQTRQRKRETPAGAGTKVLTAQNSLEDQLEARISHILTEIPTKIRLTTGPEPHAPEVTSRNPGTRPKTPPMRPLALRLSSVPSHPSLILTPAQPKTSKAKMQNGDSEVKLYHLHQVGKDAPIKLFVRLVGEGGERVMVRIGGGWADLGEYLREYASHHGRRSTSDSRFDIQGLPSSPPPNHPSSSSSRPASPTTSSSKLRSAPSYRRQQTSPAVFDSPHTPSTSSDPYLRSSSRQSFTGGTDEDSPSLLGLAGPKTRKLDMSPRKQAWVDGMLDQAKRTVSGGIGSVGDLGKVGKTKRVFLKERKDV